MNVRDEINKYAKEEDKAILLCLFERYHWQSQWSFVAQCSFIGSYPNAKRAWHPTAEGKILYEYFNKDINKT